MDTRPDHILVVDDDAEIRSLLKTYLERNGLRVTTVADGDDMWQALDKAQVDLLVLDIMLPGVDGLELCRQLRSRSRLPVIMLTARALAGALGNAQAFNKGCDFAASLGLTPRQPRTGGKDRLLGISKRGDAYLRKLLVHGARSVLRHAKDRDDALSQWLKALIARKHPNVVVVALANKTARVAWAIVHNATDYDPRLVAGKGTN